MSTLLIVPCRLTRVCRALMLLSIDKPLESTMNHPTTCPTPIHARRCDELALIARVAFFTRPVAVRRMVRVPVQRERMSA